MDRVLRQPDPPIQVLDPSTEIARLVALRNTLACRARYAVNARERKTLRAAVRDQDARIRQWKRHTIGAHSDKLGVRA